VRTQLHLEAETVFDRGAYISLLFLLCQLSPLASSHWSNGVRVRVVSMHGSHAFFPSERYIAMHALGSGDCTCFPIDVPRKHTRCLTFAAYLSLCAKQTAFPARLLDNQIL
jgi:hypothetical protein